jgi:hypothetical protein
LVCASQGAWPKVSSQQVLVSQVVLTAIEGHLIASSVQGLPAAGGAPGRRPGICIGAGPCLHLLLQNQPANSTLELVWEEAR